MAQANAEWSFFCPSECPGLAESWGEEFDRLYEQYEAEGKARSKVPAQQLWFSVLDSQMETGTPYILYKDSANRKSNQQNLGTIRSSNLCTEIIEYTAPDEVAVCNLASIALPRFVRERAADGALVCDKVRLEGSRNAANRFFDFDKLIEVTKHVTRNLNKIIDVNYYPVETARRSNMRHRPIGIGVQGLADTFILLGMPFDSDEAKQLNKDIFEALYFAALTQSCELARADGAYETYAGCPVSKGQLQFDMWGVTPSARNDWDGLREEIAKYGVRNSLLLAPMPTASTSQILGNNECFEPYTSNIYARRVLSGEFTVVNNHMLKDLIELGLWDADLKNTLVAHNGSIQRIPGIPEDLKAMYKTVWEIRQRVLVDMAADRGAYIDQSQSFNVHMSEPNFGKLTSLHFHAWRSGLKTGMYYLRTTAAADAIKFTVDHSKVKKTVDAKPPAVPIEAKAAQKAKGLEQEAMVCSLANKDECLMCGA